MDNNTLPELSETELDEIYGGKGGVPTCAQSVDGSCICDPE